MNRKTALVTGGCGQIGSHVVDELLRRGYRVVVLDPAPPLTEWLPYIESGRLVYRHGASIDIRQILALASEYRFDEIYDFGALLGCFDAETEILTRDGWKKWYEVKEGDYALTMNPNTLEAEYRPIKKVMVYRYRGDMVKIKMRGFNALVTPNHKFIRFTDNGWRWVYADDIVKRRRGVYNKWFLRSFKWRGEKLPNEIVLEENVAEMPRGGIRKYDTPNVFRREVFLKFLGWFISEGWLDYSSGGYRIVIRQINKSNADEIKKVLEEMKVKYYYDEKRDMFVFANKPLFKWLEKNCYDGDGHLARNKRVPNMLRFADSESIRLFLDTFVKGDGYVREHERVYVTSSKKLADDIMELVFKAGGIAYMGQYKRKSRLPNDREYVGLMYYVYEYDRKGKISLSWVVKNARVVSYDGIVWDVEVEPWHTIFVRRNGKAFWSGNSEELTSRLDSATMYNFLGARNVFELAKMHGARVFHISIEFAGYGFTDGYSVTKMAALRTAQEYAKKYGVFIVSALVHHVFSERQKIMPVRKILPTLISYAVTGSRFRIFGSPDKTMDMLYAGDFAGLVIDLLNHPDVETVDKHLYDIGVGYGIPISELVEMVYVAVGKEPNYVVVEDFRKQKPDPYRVARNDWGELLGDRRLRGIREMLPYIVSEYLRRYSYWDFKTAVALYEQRHRFPSIGV